MDHLRTISVSAEARQSLLLDFAALDEVTPYAKAGRLAGMVASLGIQREVGTVNDELARFIFDADTGEVVERSSLHADIVAWKDFTGVRIWSDRAQRLELRARWFHDLLHPQFSRSDDGRLRQLVIFPEIVAEIAAWQGVELVLVKSWGMNSIFGGFDPAKAYYQTNFWELENNDSLLFADLVRQGRLALLGTHDLIAHVAGVQADAWTLLKRQAERVYQAITAYFASASVPSIASLIIPYTIGVVLDDLAQPPTYGSGSHALFLDRLIEALESRAVPADFPTVLMQFPAAFEAIIQQARNPLILRQPRKAARLVDALVAEVRSHSLRSARQQGSQRGASSLS